MKVCILGPIINEEHFGGIATFDQGLKNGFLANENEVLIITDIKSDDECVRTFNKIDILINNKKIINLIKDFKPDIVIASMWYGVLNKYIKRELENTKVIQFIHGFPTYRYKIYKLYTLNFILKSIRKHSDFFVANSTFTACINTEVYGIKCDKTIHIGIEEEFVNFKKSFNEKIEFLFAGRIVKEKNVGKVCEIFKFINQYNKNINLTIVGDGPEKESLRKIYSSNNIKFVGKKSREETLEILENTDIFISLNPHEPFGLVYLEALLKKCKIICPNTGGQVEFLEGLEQVLCIDINDYKSYKEEFIRFINTEVVENEKLVELFSYFNYRRVAKELIELK